MVFDPVASASLWSTEVPHSLDKPVIWRIEVPPGAATDLRLLALLSDKERLRIDRLLRAEDRDRSVASHAALRKLLAAQLHENANTLTFEQAAGGKPRLGGHRRGDVHFNLSHSGNCALIAISPKAEIGVDVEVIRPLPDWLRVARAHFSQSEVEALAQVPVGSELRGFFACWTRKEAVVKALGAGLARPLDSFSVTVSPRPAELVEIDGSRVDAKAWSLCHLEPLEGHIGAAALRIADATFELRSPPDQWLFGAP